MNNTETLESMLDTIARLPVKDEASIRSALTDPKPATVSIGKKGIGLALGRSASVLTFANGEINSGAGISFGPIAPIEATFVLGAAEVVAPVEPTAVDPVAAHVVDPGVVVVEGDLPRRRRENGKGEPVAS